jgi:hypothetical protein
MNKIQCDVCNKFYTSKATLSTHKKKYHTQSQPPRIEENNRELVSDDDDDDDDEDEDEDNPW